MVSKNLILDVARFIEFDIIAIAETSPKIFIKYDYLQSRAISNNMALSLAITTVVLTESEFQGKFLKFF